MVTKQPNQREMDIFETSFKRQFVVPYSDNLDALRIYQNHKSELLLGMMLAKSQFNKEFDGESPQGGKFGMVPIRAAALGIGDDWDSHPSVTGGAAANWLHSGTTLMGGTAGNDVRIGENSVIVIASFASQHPSPKVEAFIPRIDGKDKGAIFPAFTKLQGANRLQLKDLDNAFLLKKDNTIRVQVFQSGTGVDIPQAMGAWFTPEDKLRVYDPVNLPGTVNDVILTV